MKKIDIIGKSVETTDIIAKQWVRWKRKRDKEIIKFSVKSSLFAPPKQ